MIRTGLPRAGRATLRQNTARNSDILHLLHATPSLRGTLGGQPIQSIQDLVTIRDINVSIMGRGEVFEVLIVPNMTKVDFRWRSDRIEFFVPEVRGHQMIEICYRDN
jgi:hypothetical protein